MKKIFCAISVLFLLITQLSALEVKEGRIKLTIAEDSGRFVISYLKTIDKQDYENLFFADDPRTSILTLLLDGKTYKLGDSADFRVSVVRLDFGVQIEFKSSLVSVKEVFTFIKSKDAVLADGIRLDLIVDNVSEKDKTIGFRYLIDTNLGEPPKTHFATDLRTKIDSETILNSESKDTYWISQGKSGIGLLCMIDSEGVTKPDQIVFANWKRLSDASWTFEPNPGRSFDEFPYSINDSAVAMYYNPTLVARSLKKVVTILFGNVSGSMFSLNSDQTKTEEMFKTTVLNSSSDLQSKTVGVQTDLIAVKDLLDQIDRKLAEGKALSAEEIQVFKKVLEQLKARKANY